MSNKELELAYFRLSILHSDALLKIQFLENQLENKSMWYRIKYFLSFRGYQ